MKEFNFVFKNYMSNVNYLLCTDIPYDTSKDSYPDDHYIALDIQNYALAFGDCSMIVSEFTRDLVRKRTGYLLSYKDKIKINGKLFYVISSNSEINKLEKAKIPTYIPKS